MYKTAVYTPVSGIITHQKQQISEKVTLLSRTLTLGQCQSNQIKSNYFIVRLKVDQRAGQLSLPHLGITKTEKIELKHKTEEQISPVNGLEP